MVSQYQTKKKLWAWYESAQTDGQKDRQTDRCTDRQTKWFLCTPLNFVPRGYNNLCSTCVLLFQILPDMKYLCFASSDIFPSSKHLWLAFFNLSLISSATISHFFTASGSYKFNMLNEVQNIGHFDMILVNTQKNKRPMGHIVHMRISSNQ